MFRKKRQPPNPHALWRFPPLTNRLGAWGFPPTTTTDTDSDEEETTVRIFKYNGVKYLKAADNTIYDFESHEELGLWNEQTNSIEVT